VKFHITKKNNRDNSIFGLRRGFSKVKPSRRAPRASDATTNALLEGKKQTQEKRQIYIMAAEKKLFFYKYISLGVLL
jgi:hypothetical protein